MNHVYLNNKLTLQSSIHFENFENDFASLSAPHMRLLTKEVQNKDKTSSRLFTPVILNIWALRTPKISKWTT